MNVSERMIAAKVSLNTALNFGGNLCSWLVLCVPEPFHDARLETGLLRDEQVPAPRAAAAPEREAAGGPDVVVIERLRPQSAPARRRLRLSQRRLEAAETPSFADGAFCHSPSTFFTNLGRYFSDHKR